MKATIKITGRPASGYTVTVSIPQSFIDSFLNTQRIQVAGESLDCAWGSAASVDPSIRSRHTYLVTRAQADACADQIRTDLQAAKAALQDVIDKEIIIDL